MVPQATVALARTCRTCRMAAAPQPQTARTRAVHLRSVVDRQLAESRFRAALTRDLLAEPVARWQRPAG